MSLFSSANSSGHPNMDVHHISREYPFSEPSLRLLTSQQELSASQLELPARTNSRVVSTRHNNRSKFVEERRYPQPSPSLLTLPQKRSNHSLISGRIGDVEESHPRAFTGIYSAKRLKGPITSPLPISLSSCNSVVTVGLPRPLLDLSEANTVSREPADPAEAGGDLLDSDDLKTLRSPFEYTPDLVAPQIDTTAKTDIRRFDSDKSEGGEESSGYVYYAPTNPSDKANPTLDAHRRVPRRKLSYGGDPPSKPGPRLLHKTTASWELRLEAERDAEDYGLDSWLDSTLSASAPRPYHSEPIRSKPRVWLDLSEEKGNIQEAHAITIRTSPSKPQVISTLRRRATIHPFEKATPVCPDHGFSVSYPHTPPSTPAFSESVVGLGIKSVIDKKHEEAYERIKAKPTWTQTPPSSNPSSTGTVRRVPAETTPPVRADTPRPAAPVQPQLSELTSWIITELEASIAETPQINLQLDSPVILQICLPAGQRRIPRKTPQTLPLSRYSNFNGPLYSHPTNSSSKFPMQAPSPNSPPAPPTNISMRSLHIIFPYASSQLLSSLQATYLALHYIATIHLPSPATRSPASSFIETNSPLSPKMSYIPAKARAMLGLEIPTTRPALPVSWTRPETRAWRERIEELKCKLRSEVVRLIGTCEGSDLGRNEALVRAVGEIVTFGQEDAHRSS